MQNNFTQTFIDTKPSIPLSVVAATLNDERSIKKTLDALSRLVNVDEVVVVDGGSVDRTVEIVESYENLKKLKLIKIAEPNRARRLNEGARQASGEVLWFLHADSQPVQGSGRQIKRFMRYGEIVGGNFEVAFAENARARGFLRKLYPYLRQTGIVYVDSAIFVRREVFERIGGFRPLADFEDLDLYKRLQKQRGRFVHINLPVTTGVQRLGNGSFLQTFPRWSFYQTLYWLGVPVRVLAKFYKKPEK